MTDIVIPPDADKPSVFKQAEQFLNALHFNVAAIDDKRPWGGFFALAETDAPKFIRTFFPHLNLSDFEGYAKLSPKILLVAPHKRLSWQYHHRRAEIWKLIGGRAAIVVSATDAETEEQPLSLGTEVNLNQGERHRLVGTTEWGVIAEIWKHTDPSNPSDEADIVRVQDDFGR